MNTGSVTLNNGIDMPAVGIGGWEQKKEQIADALSVGYRMVDTASQYGNERDVGEGIRASGLPRERIFITSKLWTEDIRRRRTREAFFESLARLEIDQMDLYLIHWPAEGFEEAWIEMEKLYQDGYIRAIGVSNFQPHHLDALKEIGATITPAINQVESHPYFQNARIVESCEQRGIIAEAWCPLGGPSSKALKDDKIDRIAKEKGKTPAQVILRWHLQRGVAVIPKSANKERMKQNLELFDFALSVEEINAINDLECGRRLGAHPDHFDF